jgi:dienelactone hydrolase
MLRRVLVLIAALLVVACAGTATTRCINVERSLDDGPSFSAYLVSYRSDGLKLYAMVAVPELEMPEKGFPVVIANHGYVPDPTKYGITAAGIDSRPGDYYRSVPELYASRGFLVVLPDYRGHNSSEGFEFVHKPNSVDLYADDVITLLASLDEIEEADTEKLFMWSHSMGGGVSMRVQLATENIKAASYWATMSVSDLESGFGELDGAVMIHHAIDDKSTEHSNAQRLAGALQTIEHPFFFYTYESSDHYFTGDERELAADRDAAFFTASVE